MDSIYLRLSLTSECNLRCRYCRPSSGEHASRESVRILTDIELLDVVGAVNAVMPIRKLRFTGGEPLLRPNLEELIAAFHRRLPDTDLFLTTNGIILKERAQALKRAGLRSLNISLDTLDEDGFERLTGIRGLWNVLRGIAAARSAGFERLKLNTVLMRSFNFGQLPSLVRLAARHDCEIRFVELMPYGAGADLFASDFLSADEALLMLRESFPYLRREEPSATAKRHVLDVDGKEVTIGFITSVSSPFCEGCDRIRLDSAGRIYPCLRSMEGVELAQAEKGDARERIRRILLEKKTPAISWPKRSMVQMGG